MIKEYDISFKEYLKLLNDSHEKSDKCNKYEDYKTFNDWVKLIFWLRAKSEEFYQDHQYVAESTRGALPLEWSDIEEILDDNEKPEENLITQIAKNDFASISHIINSHHKTLSRIRKKLHISYAQQLDAYCLRWLTKQPGYTPAEKAGSKQEIYSVFHFENSDTLENRVFKDFIKRLIPLCEAYCQKNYKFRRHPTYESVNKLSKLCLLALEQKWFINIKNIDYVINPNYVLQQNYHYNKVWNSYRKLILQENIAIKLWEKRDEVETVISKLTDPSLIKNNKNKARFYNNKVWINEINGRDNILDELNDSTYVNSIGKADYIIDKKEKLIIDICSSDVKINASRYHNKINVYSGYNDVLCVSRRKNESPYIENPFLRTPNEKPGKRYNIVDIFFKDNIDSTLVTNYFRQLYGLYGGKEWLFLVPDNWDSVRLEKIRRAALMVVPDIQFLWRSIAFSLSYLDKNYKSEYLNLIDEYPNLSQLGISLKIINGVPQRSSYKKNSDRYWVYNHFSTTDRYNIKITSDHLFLGAITYLRFNKSEVLYYDELDAITLIYQMYQKETIEKGFLVEKIEKWEGGRKFEGGISDRYLLKKGDKRFSLYLYDGNPGPSDFLKIWETEFDEPIPAATYLNFKAEVVPGQGLAKIQVFADCLEQSIELDLMKVKESDKSIIILENELDRSFPPDLPLVQSLVSTNEYIIKDYLRGGTYSLKGMFNKEQYYYQLNTRFRNSNKPIFDSNIAPAIDRFRRINVFGNDPNYRYPDLNIDFDKLIQKLVNDYNRTGDETLITVLSWTYQYDNDIIEPIREEIYERFIYEGKLSRSAPTFFSYSFDTNDYRLPTILFTCFEQLKDELKENRLRLALKLLQYNPNILSDYSFEDQFCMDIMNKMAYYYKHIFYEELNETTKNKRLNYLLQILLFMLNRRRFSRTFYYQDDTWPKGTIFQKQLFKENLDQTRLSFIKYVKGKGNIEGLPLVIEENE